MPRAGVAGDDQPPLHSVDAVPEKGYILQASAAYDHDVSSHIQHSSSKKGRTLSPELKDTALIRIVAATPYAGITRVRFKGYDLSR